MEPAKENSEIRYRTVRLEHKNEDGSIDYTESIQEYRADGKPIENPWWKSLM